MSEDLRPDRGSAPEHQRVELDNMMFVVLVPWEGERTLMTHANADLREVLHALHHLAHQVATDIELAELANGKDPSS